MPGFLQEDPKLQTKVAKIQNTVVGDEVNVAINRSLQNGAFDGEGS